MTTSLEEATTPSQGSDAVATRNQPASTTLVTLTRGEFVTWVSLDDGSEQGTRKFAAIGVTLNLRPVIGRYGGVNNLIFILEPNGPMHHIHSVTARGNHRVGTMNRGWDAPDSSSWLKFTLPMAVLEIAFNGDDPNASVTFEFMPQ